MHEKKTEQLIINLLYTGKVEPAYYVSFPPSTFDENSYRVSHSLGNCTPSNEEVDSHNEEVVICPNGELLLDGVIEANLEDNVVDDEDIQYFYTWRESSIPDNRAFITLQFPDAAVTPTKVVVYFLELRDLDVREPRNIRLYSSITESIFPDDEIRNVDENVDIIMNGIIANNDRYEYGRIDLIIPQSRQVSLKYLRISLDFEGTNWIFISEVEVYHMFEPCKLSVKASEWLAIFVFNYSIYNTSAYHIKYFINTSFCPIRTYFHGNIITTITCTCFHDNCSACSGYRCDAI